jgi:hypothetical protein
MVVGGEEVSLHQMKKNGLVDMRAVDDGDGHARMEFATSVSNIAKIFVQDTAKDLKRWYSFYFRIKTKTSPLVTIRPFPPASYLKEGDTGVLTGFFFRARGGFLTQNEALEILSAESPSRGYLKNQRLLPIETLKKMVTIDRNVLREGVRVVRIGNKT